MKRYNRKDRRQKGGRSLGEVEDGTEEINSHPTFIDAAKDSGLIVVTAIASCFVGAAIGRASFFAGIPVTIAGVYKKNPYIVAAGLGLALSNGFQRVTGVQGVNGIDFKQVSQDAKDRVSTFFENFKEKLYLPKKQSTSAASATNGLGDTQQQEQVTYFVNPYRSEPANTLAEADSTPLADIDMSAIDRLQEQIADMSKGGVAIPNTDTAGLNEVEREF